MQEKVEIILSNVDLTGFTELLKGEQLFRYVVAFTHNGELSFELLEAQVNWFGSQYENITIGGRTDPQGNIFVDVGTSTDSLVEARQLQEQYNQQAIWDSEKKEEIR